MWSRETSNLYFRSMHDKYPLDQDELDMLKDAYAELSNSYFYDDPKRHKKAVKAWNTYLVMHGPALIGEIMKGRECQD